MKSFWLLLLFCLTTWGAQAQSASAPAFDYAAFQPLAKGVLLPGLALFLLGYFILAAVRLALNYLLKRQILASTVSESVVERLVPGPQDERNKVVKWISLLFSSGAGLTISTLYPPLGIHSIIILIFSTAVGFLAYFLYLNRKTK